MAGLAAGIRVAMYDRSVVVLERHNAPGGLNSFYAREGRKFDVGLHALTNFARPGQRGAPLAKLFRQLRIPWDAIDLNEQNGSRIWFPGVELRFANEFGLLEEEVAACFPSEIDGFRQLRSAIADLNPFTLPKPDRSARAFMSQFLHDRTLTDMLLCPLMFYGSARTRDMDLDQFVVLWRAVFEEGFCRPFEGVRPIIRALLNRYREVGGKRWMKCGVRRLHVEDGRVATVELDDGRRIRAQHVISTAGRDETYRLCGENCPQDLDAASDRLSFAETISILDTPPSTWGWNDTIIFFNRSERFAYEKAVGDCEIDDRSGVICFPNNYRYSGGRDLEDGILRITAIANYDYWTRLSEEDYNERKTHWFLRLRERAQEVLETASEHRPNLQAHTVFSDMFTPRTITRFTGHWLGAVYGSPLKSRDGSTPLANLYIAGTDQGFVGVVGAILSGVSMANRHVLMGD